MSIISSPGTPRLNLINLIRTRALVSDRFTKLLTRLQPAPSAILKFAAHRSSVTIRLKTCFALSQIFPIGSASRDSAIRQSSDLDLLVVLRKQEVFWGGSLMSSETVLRNMRNELTARFFRSDLGKDGQAITINFGDGQYPVDVVPAILHEMTSIGGARVPVYAIPNGGGGWQFSSPAAHNNYISMADKQSGGKLKNVAKMMKYWRWCRTPEIPLSSFHLELLLASERICAGVKSYSSCLSDLLTELLRRDARALIDPVGVSGYIKAASTEAKQQRVLAAVRESAFHASRAMAAEAAGNAVEALRQWDIVFNGGFPKS